MVCIKLKILVDKPNGLVYSEGMENNNTVTLQFTREFTGGTLKGIRHDDSIRFASRDAAADYLAAGRKGFKRPVGGSPWKIVEEVIV